MKTLHLLLALTLTVGLTACNKNEVVDTLTSTTDSVTQTGGELMEMGEDAMQDAKVMGGHAMEGMEEGKAMMGDAMEKGAELMEDVQAAGQEALETGEDMLEKTGELMEQAEKKVTALAAASYTDYSESAGDGQKHILFFYADWCPTCVKWEGQLNDNMGALPDNALILKVDYDNADELKAQYKITKQSTAVFVNADGSVAKTESDPSVESMTAFFSS